MRGSSVISASTETTASRRARSGTGPVVTPYTLNATTVAVTATDASTASPARAAVPGPPARRRRRDAVVRRTAAATAAVSATATPAATGQVSSTTAASHEASAGATRATGPAPPGAEPTRPEPPGPEPTGTVPAGPVLAGPVLAGLLRSARPPASALGRPGSPPPSPEDDALWEGVSPKTAGRAVERRRKGSAGIRR
ncbi:hypothetical protein [Microbispora triticiradicis]|uniref:hypothetical protein n=1 Tax=Microbispora triticiradicis TaxID=2200763 RepID=UPI00296E2A18|nr:hypothetical protein [Microbispora triticiradicis]